MIAANDHIFNVERIFTLGSDLRVIGQMGTTICIDLLLDSLIVRTLLMPPIATLVGCAAPLTAVCCDGML